MATSDSAQDSSGIVPVFVKESRNFKTSFYTWRGFSGDVGVTNVIPTKDVEVEEVAFGENHTLVLTTDGHVFVKGKNDLGQLGLGSSDTISVEDFLKVEAIKEQAVAIACGSNHCAVVTISGNVYCWGDSTQGQCGVGTLDVVHVPTSVKVEISQGFCQHGVPKPGLEVKIKAVSCGTVHTLALAQDGSVWSWGFGPQLGLGDLHHAPVPRCVTTLEGRTALAVCCGASHSIALLACEAEDSKVSSKKKSSSESSSRRIKVPAKEVKEDKHFPSICSTCHKEIYTYTDTSDMCIIDTVHDCRVQDSSHCLDSTVVEDVGSPESSTTDIERTEGDHEALETVDNAQDNVNSQNVSLSKSENANAAQSSSKPVQGTAADETTTKESEANETSETKTPEEDDANISQGASYFLENSAIDSSILFIPTESPFEADPSLPTIEEASTQDASKEGVDGASEKEIKGATAAADETDSKAKEEEEEEEEEMEDIWLRRSESEEISEDDSLCFVKRDRVHSASTISLKSSLNLANQSEAMDFLQRQLSEDNEQIELRQSSLRASSTPKKDEGSPQKSEGSPQKSNEGSPQKSNEVSPQKSKESSPQKTDSGASQKSEKKETSMLSGVFSSTSNVMTQMKSMTSSAISNLQNISGFGSASSSSSSSPSASKEEKENKEQKENTEEKEKSPSDLGSPSSSVAMSASLSTDDSPDGEKSRVGKSGTFIEWQKELKAAEDGSGEDKAASSSRSLRTINMQKENLYRSSLSSQSEEPSVPCYPPVVTVTEVWTWGINKQGQLGLGDLLDRCEPVHVKIFTGLHIVKVAAGQAHNIALTSNSQVYSWGANSYGQLGHKEIVHKPTRIRITKGASVWDVAAGSSHSLFLGDINLTHPDVIYAGKQPSKDAHSSMVKTSTPKAIGEIRKLGPVIQIKSGFGQCACKVLNPPPPETSAVFELAASERSFFTQLIKTSNLLLRPFKRSAFYSTMDVFPYKSSLGGLVLAFTSLTNKIEDAVTDLKAAIQSQRPLHQTLMLGAHHEIMASFRNYSRAFSDFMSVGGFDYCTKTCSEFFDEIQETVKDLPEAKDKGATSGTLFMRAMRYPFFRPAEYSRLISKIAAAVEDPDFKSHLSSVVLDWESAKLNLTSEHKTAGMTKTFWETANLRVSDPMRIPSRRLLRESKSYPLLWSGGSRFSTPLFVLFNDVFLHYQNNVLMIYPLETVWVESPDSGNKNGLSLITPEERFELMAPDPAQKTEWLLALNSAISKVLTDQKAMPSFHGSGARFTPPLIRHAKHKFIRTGPYKDAQYNGTWLSGKVHGLGEMKWQNGSVYEGNFVRGLMHGSGTLKIVKNGEPEIRKGIWKDGKLNGLANIRYANGDIYEGYIQDDQRFGQGTLKVGQQKSNCVSIYVGEWLNNLREGYGVQDDILKGEKYMGMWSEDNRHGTGVLVTLDGMYFEGNFVQNKLTGFGVMVSDDHTLYEGDFMGITHLSGKGTLTLHTGDKLEGSFSGSINEGLKVNGTFSKAVSSPDSDKLHQSTAGIQSKYFGRLCVPADEKWSDIFSHALSALGQSQNSQVPFDTEKAWESVAVMVSTGRSIIKEDSAMSNIKAKTQLKLLEGLEKIPKHHIGSLNLDTLEELYLYLAKACESTYHPLGQLMNTLVDVFRATYIGVGAHPRLLHHAVREIRSYVRRIYRVVRILFPDLPANGGPVNLYPASSGQNALSPTSEEFVEGLEEEDPNIHVLTAPGLIYPLLLPKIYPPLFDLYALYNEKSDDRYFERVTKLNRQSDMGLMAYLGIEQRFWLMDDILQQDGTQKMSTIKDKCYAEAVDALQQLSTAFSPLEKLKIIEKTFLEVNKTVSQSLQDGLVWCMDDLFPIFQFVVVRAKIHHLGAEIHMIEDLLEPHMEHGEFGLMFTTLKACYFQIQNEKMPR